MYILAIETTGPFGSVALIDSNNKILGHEVSKDTMNHLKDLMPMIKRLLEGCEITGEELTHIACSIGPGSFTGIRIGVSTARALAQAWGIKTVACSSLESFSMREGLSGNSLVCAVYNARRGQIYGYMEDLMEEGAWMLDDIFRKIEEAPLSYRLKKFVFYGDGIDAYEDKLREGLDRLSLNYEFAPRESRYQDAREVARLALKKAELGLFLNYDELLPEYMREAEAEQKLKAGQLPICKLPKQE